ncbi:hypothetical protein Hamer_G007044 [Homarus americanus]|uniref:Uncharacterized protein n=1 Tax=Homarus americanus TaxID=6706 RepID=A0A8J5T489_HOMAM|nr:hypothetical protein Hamer_G007044 [Homarus americanus]
MHGSVERPGNMFQGARVCPVSGPESPTADKRQSCCGSTVDRASRGVYAAVSPHADLLTPLLYYCTTITTSHNPTIKFHARVSDGDQHYLYPKSPGPNLRTLIKALSSLWVVWWVLVGVDKTRAAHTDTAPGPRCIPCNSTVKVEDSELPAVGFMCPEGSPDDPLHHPYTCLVFFEQPHNLTIHLHHFHPDLMSVVLCSLIYYYAWPELVGSEDRLCADMQMVIRLKDVDHPVYLNISTLPRGPHHQHHHPPRPQKQQYLPRHLHGQYHYYLPSMTRLIYSKYRYILHHLLPTRSSSPPRPVPPPPSPPPSTSSTFSITT